jgi:F-type H+-transporting ATPase subunit b
MQVDATTLVLEIVNFLVLVWILKRFLYRPVLDVIAQRRAAIEKSLAEARAARAAAEDLKTRYEGRLAESAEEHRRGLDALGAEIDAERTRRRADLAAEIAREKDKAAAASARERAEARERVETAALAQGARFASRLLARIGDEHLEQRLIELAIEDLAALPADRAAALRDDGDGTAPVVVTTGHALEPSLRSRLERALAPLVAGTARKVTFERDPALVAGVRVRIGGFSLGLNLRDELQGFTGLSRER